MFVLTGKLLTDSIYQQSFHRTFQLAVFQEQHKHNFHRMSQEGFACSSESESQNQNLNK